MTQPALDVDPTVHLRTTVNQPFEVSLRSPGAAGYEWRPKFDGEKLRLITKRRQAPGKKSFGAAASDIFRFEPLERGAFEVVFDLSRPWEPGPVAQRGYTIEVK